MKEILIEIVLLKHTKMRQTTHLKLKHLNCRHDLIINNKIIKVSNF